MDKWESIGSAAVFIALIAAFASFYIYDKYVILEAIKAGLVQDKAGHWVKPPTNSPPPTTQVESTTHGK